LKHRTKSLKKNQLELILYLQKCPLPYQPTSLQLNHLTSLNIDHQWYSGDLQE
jgi:hypothetical protein